MSVTLSTGTSVYIASTLGAAKSFSSISNATEAVASFSSDPSLTTGDIMVVTSGWGRLNDRVVRVKSTSGSGPYLVTFEDVDTSDTDRYPAGSGTGSVQEVTAWTEITQIKSIGSSGGDQQFADITSLSDVVAKQVPTIRSAVSMDLEVFDDPTLAYYDVVTAASDSSSPVALKMAFANSSYLYANAYWSVQKVPGIATNEALTSKITLSYAADPIRYAS